MQLLFNRGNTVRAGRTLRAVHAHFSHCRTPEKLDLVALRAVAALDKCISQGCQFVAEGGTFVAYKSADVSTTEVESAARAGFASGLTPIEPFDYEMGSSDRPLTRTLHILADVK